MQWTRLPGGETPTAFVERIQRLLSGETRFRIRPQPFREQRCRRSSAAPPSVIRRRRTGVLYGAIAAAVLLALGYFGLERLNRSKPRGPGDGLHRGAAASERERGGEPAVLLRWDIGRSDHRAIAVSRV